MDFDIDSIFVSGFESFVASTTFILIVGLIIWFSVGKKVDRYNETHPEHAVSGQFITAAVRFADFIFMVLVVAQQVIPLRPAVDMLLSAGGVLAICSTFAARESLGNYIAGFLLSIHKPFKIGDAVALHMHYMITAGTVMDMTFRHTVIETDEGNIMTVPNSVMNSIAIEVLPEQQSW